MTVSWATHRLPGVSAPINALYTLRELEHHLKATGCKALFTCKALVEPATKAADSVGIPRSQIFLLDVSAKDEDEDLTLSDFMTLNQIISEASQHGPLEQLIWERGQGVRQIAYLVSSSGTTGLPVGCSISLDRDACR